MTITRNRLENSHKRNIPFLLPLLHIPIPGKKQDISFIKLNGTELQECFLCTQKPPYEKEAFALKSKFLIYINFFW